MGYTKSIEKRNIRAIYIKSKKGFSTLFLVVIFTLFVIAIYYIIATSPFHSLYDITKNTTNDTGYQNTFTQIHTIWFYLPALAFVLTLIWWISRTIRGED